MLTLLALEGALITLVGVALGAVTCTLAVALLGPWIQTRSGIALRLALPTATEWSLLAALLVGGLLASLVPGWRAYRLSLADGLSPRS